jgi:GntR family transcriptional repressor for pyruvate dehydrogenase complex
MTDPQANPDTTPPGATTDDHVAMQVVRHIRQLIESGKLRGGERLPPEREFARELGISRASLRAGVGYLAAMGVLNVRHGVGTFVDDGPPALSAASFELMYSLHGFTPRQIFEARLIIEGNLAALAAERGRDEQFDALADEVIEMEATHDHPQAYLIHDVRFHRLIGEASGNPILGAIMETISASFYDTRRLTVAHARDLRDSTEMHRDIYRAVRKRDSRGARRLMELHLRKAEQALAAEAESTSRIIPRAESSSTNSPAATQLLEDSQD